MRSSIEIDDALLRKALKASGLGSMRAVVEEGLRLLVKDKDRGSIRHLRGKILLEPSARETRTGE